ncbi:MAG: FAD-dependent oxidoreductase, partial [Dehalococcoidales bacterium]|nr:FAD-dependent oxidoreductase [Dehalococcoidales bacterium]
MPAKFENLLSPGFMGTMKLRNRVVLPPMVRNYATIDGIITKRLVDHYAARAKGGAGLIIVESSLVHLSGKAWHQGIGIYDDRCIPGLADLAEAVKSWGCKISIQLTHSGRRNTLGILVAAPSAIPSRLTLNMPRELTIAEIAELVEAYAQAARRAKQAGFDAVEMHGAHGYLINQFLSPVANKRTDKYGGDINGRTTFVREIIKRTKELCGNSYPIMVRINGEDFAEGGNKIEDTVEIAKILEAAGVAALDIGAGMSEPRSDPGKTRPSTIISAYGPRGLFVPYAAQVKSAVKIPVIAVGGITPEAGEEILRQGKADFVAMGRSQLADPELVNKVARGELEDIRPCTRCVESCLGRVPLGIRCCVNAEVGFESETLKAALQRKKVLVVGGGAAGMEAARVAALRGHGVTLYEQSGKLGGHFVEATVPDFKSDLKHYYRWLVQQVKKTGVKVELGKVVTVKTVAAAKPDAVIVATGSVACRPEIPGIDKPSVASAIDIMLGKSSAGSVNLVAGGNAIGCETAVYLAQQGKKVVVIEMLADVAADLPATRSELINLMAANNVEIRTGLKVIAITDSGVTAVDSNGKQVELAGDKVVLALGLTAQAGLYDELRDKVR